MSATAVRRAVIAVAVVILAAFPLISGNLYVQDLLIMTFLLGIGATGWNIMGGYAGYISLGNSLFIGLGAYTTGILAVRAHLSPFARLPGRRPGLRAGRRGILSLVTRRTRGMYFVIVTFAALQLLGIVATTWSGLTGGSQGLALPLPTWSLSYQNWPFYYPLLGLLVLTVAVSAVVRRSKLGLGLFAIADDEDKAAGLGLRTDIYKMIAFVFGGTFVGIAGGLYAYYVSFLNVAAVFDIVTSVLIVLAALLGGRGTLWGPVLGAFILEPLANFTSTGLGGADAGAIRLLLFGGLLGAVVLFLPRGVLPTVTRAWPRVQRPGRADHACPRHDDRSSHGARTRGGAGTGHGARTCHNARRRSRPGGPGPGPRAPRWRGRAAGPRAGEGVRRPARRRRGRPDRDGRPHHRAPRPQRLGQDHPVQPHRRHGGRVVRPGHPRGPVPRPPGPRGPGARRAGPDLPAPAAVPEPDRRRERRRRPAALLLPPALAAPGVRSRAGPGD